MKIYRTFFKMTKATQLFKKGQKVWLLYYLDDAAYVIGRYKGNGKWIRAVIRPQFKSRYSVGNGKPNAKEIERVLVKGYLKKLFFIFDFNVRYNVSLQVDDLKYINLKTLIKDFHRKEQIENEIEILTKKLKYEKSEIEYRIKSKILTAKMEKEREKCNTSNLTISQLRKLDWLKT